MSDQAIDIRKYMEQIRKMAVRAHANMNHRSGFTIDDLISEGEIVFFKDALPHFKKVGEAGHRANFKSYLTTCLRNHFFGLMKSSYRQAVNDDIFDENGHQIREDPKAVYTRHRESMTADTSPEDRVTFKYLIEDIISRLDEREARYFELLMAGHLRPVIRKMMGVSYATERKLRTRLQRKVVEVL